MSIGVIVAAGGRGVRLGGSLPKQFLDLGGQTILARSARLFDAHPRVSEIVIVLPEEFVAQGSAMVGPLETPVRFVVGGVDRQDSVRHGLEALSSDSTMVLIHDAARPFVDPALVDRVISATEQSGAAVPAIRARDTVKRVDRDGLVRETISRDEIWLAQTPQGFARDVLDSAMRAQANVVDATDEAMIVERSGHTVRVIEGDERNIKITSADDLKRARSLMGSDHDLTPYRVGTGYDLHRLSSGPGHRLIFAGVVIATDFGPVAHSDGDVVCHALIDAMLGAAALGDIGRHFPDSDARWKSAGGLDLLERTIAVIKNDGWVVASADVTVLLERPKLSSHVDEIRSRLAGIIGVAVDHVGLKAKTNEGVDAVGRGEAIAAHAIAVLTLASGR